MNLLIIWPDRRDDVLQLVRDVQLVRVKDQDDPIDSGSEPVNPDQTGLKHLSFGRINFR